MAHIILGVTGSVAAIRTPLLCAALREGGNEVRVVATQASRYFFDTRDLGKETPVFSDGDEWPGQRYRRDDPVLHIAFRNWADLLMIAPLDANTLGKIALGLCDNFLTCLFRAWDFLAKPVILAPAMNTLMWQSPVTRRHLKQLLDDWGDGRPGDDWTLATADAVFARHAPHLVLVPPQTKRLACGDVGMGAMAEVATLAETVRHWITEVAAELHAHHRPPGQDGP